MLVADVSFTFSNQTSLDSQARPLSCVQGMYGYAQDIDLIQDGQLPEVRMHGELGSMKDSRTSNALVFLQGLALFAQLTVPCNIFLQRT